MTKEKAEHNYFSQLDGIRTIAVGLVLVDHWLSERNVLPLGALGVTMFFVLSGFLIIRILILGKIKDEKIGRSHWFTIKQFIVRRSLRIFPVYFLTIFACYYFNVPMVRETIAWTVLYATNLYIAFHKHWLGVLDHLWSLAVEEQFYLIFPYLILFLPKKYFLKLFSLMILVSLALRLYLWFRGTDWVVQYVFMPTCLDAFGLGGFLAYIYTFKKDTIYEQLNKNLYLIISLLLYIGVVIYTKVAFEAIHNFGNLVLERFLGSLFSFFLILRAISGFKGAMRWLLENPVSVYLGRISYGIYLYHNFVYNYYHTQYPSHPTMRILHKLQQFVPSITHHFAFELWLYLCITVVVATLSWYLIEKPVNDLKKHFNY
ncbi:acyltransferase family protein [Flectobacillus major]|jgi:peptidoglycan/LPS O-acetylase OafA/YrhL|uniref:acyltransferase family protein n=1 Tax=Flectobacillus major TaxID=103 RepID=UPI000429A1D0|nr:acyltransferase [Flectobacillus major]